MSELLTALAVLFISGGAFVLLANYARLPTVPFLLLAGVVSGLFIDEQLTLELAQWGIAFLVFSFGAQIQFEAVEPVFGDGELIALGQVGVVGTLGFASGLLVGLAVSQAVFLGVATALSSTIVGTALIEQDIRNQLVHSRLAESIQFVQDLLAIVFVIAVAVETVTPGSVAVAVGSGVAVLVAGVLVNRLLFDRLGRLAGGSDELMIVSVVALLVAFLATAEFAGVSIVVGAFAAGLAVRGDRAEYIGVMNGIDSITTFFAAVFFMTVGGLVAVPTPTVLLTAGVLVLLTAIVKPAVTIIVASYRGYTDRSAVLTGLSLDQVSEFALIIAIEALLLGLLLQSVFDAIILAAAVTMISSTLTSRHSQWCYRLLVESGVVQHRHESVDNRSSVPETLSDHVVIVGFGRRGQQLADRCEALGQPVVVIENDPALLEQLESTPAYVFGDAMEPYVREKAAIDTATLVISTIDSTPLSEQLLTVDDDVDLIFRAERITDARRLLESGALYVAVPNVLAAERLVELTEELLAGDRSPRELRTAHREQLTEDRPPESGRN